jgi:toxin ParE1/3/4
MKSHIFHPEAASEYLAAAEYYARINPELGGRFYDEIERLVRDIRNQPDRFLRYDPPAQRHFSDVFPYAIIYVERADRIIVLAVMHFKRRPGYWKQRLK